MRIGRPVMRLMLAGLLPALLAGCGGVLDPQGPVAGAERKILFDALAIMLALIGPTLIGAALIAWWFRADNKRAQYRPTFTFSGRLEILIWSVPTLIIVFLGGLIWFGSHELDPYKPLASDKPPLRIQVVSLDWKWLFVYPDQGVATVNDMVIPAGQPIALDLTSASVMNTFWVPQLAGMVYTMNGMVTKLHLQADNPGDYPGRSGNLSGDGFSQMHFTVHAVASDAFPQWVERAKASGNALDRGAYEALTKPSTVAAPITYQSVQDDLFQQVAMQDIPPGPGPANRPATKQSEN